MPLPGAVSDISTVPEAQRSLYVQQGEQYVLDVDIDTHPGVGGLKKKEGELLGKLKGAEAFRKVAGALTVEQLAEELTFARTAREKAATEAGDFETVKKQMREAHESEMGGVRSQLETLEGQLYDTLATSEAKSALSAAGFQEPDVMLPHLLPHIDVVLENGRYTARVVNADGSVRVGDANGTPMSIKQLAETFAKDGKYAGLLAASGASGGGARNVAAGAGGAAAVVVIPKNSTPQEYRRLKGEAEKRGVPYRVSD